MSKTICLLGTTLLTVAAQAQSGQWSELPPLPLAVSGHFAGTSRGALITVGGAHFPIPLYEGGTKKWLPDIQVLPQGGKAWQTARPLNQPSGYGASVSDGKGLICLGGGDAQVHSKAVFRLEWTKNGLRRTELPPLPKACAFMSAALLDKTIYVSGGQETPTSTSALNSLWALSLKDKNATWQTLAPCPGPGRILPVMAAQDGALYLISGASLAPDAAGKAQRTYLIDAWRYRPNQGWDSVTTPPRALVAAPHASWGKTQILVFGGDDGALAARAQELKDQHPGFSRDVLAYDTRQNVWMKVDTLPVGLVTTNAVREKQGIIIPGGEDRPGHRNPRVLRYTPTR